MMYQKIEWLHFFEAFPNFKYVARYELKAARVRTTIHQEDKNKIYKMVNPPYS
jgi:hypothetical protein